MHMACDDPREASETSYFQRRRTTCRRAMLGPTEVFTPDEWAGLPPRSNEDDTQFLEVVEGNAASWGKDEIRSRGLSARPERNLRQKRRQALALVGFGILALTFAILRCAIKGIPSRKAGGDVRSLVGPKRVDAPAACLGDGGDWFEGRGAPDAKLSEQELQKKASGFMNSLLTIVKSNEPVLVRIPMQTRSKVLSLLLTLFVQELAALASVIGEDSRAALVHTVGEVSMITCRLGTTITRRKGGVCSRRLQLYLSSILRRLELSGPQGSFLPPTERLQKLHELLLLQEAMLENLSVAFNKLTRLLSSGCDPDDAGLIATTARLGDLLHIRKKHILSDPLLSRWLLERENQGKRFGVASPGYITQLRLRKRPTVEKMLEELTTLLSVRGKQHTAGQHCARVVKAEDRTAEHDEPPSEEAELQEVEESTVSSGHLLESGHVSQEPSFLGQAVIPSHPVPAAWYEGWGFGYSKQFSYDPELPSSEVRTTSALHHTKGTANLGLLSLPYAFSDPSPHWVSGSCTVMLPVCPAERVYGSTALRRQYSNTLQ